MIEVNEKRKMKLSETKSHISLLEDPYVNGVNLVTDWIWKGKCKMVLIKRNCVQRTGF